MKLVSNIEFSSGDNFEITNNSISFDLKKEGNIYSHNFFFCITDAIVGQVLEVIVRNASNSNFAKGWSNYNPFYSYDNRNFHRTSNSNYENGFLRFKILVKKSTIFIACYPPYYNEYLTTFLKERNIELKYLNNSNIHYYCLGEEKQPTYLFLNRQHCGEFQGSYFLEGVVEEVLKSDIKIRIIVFPLVNYSGYKICNHRLDDSYNDLNRLWTSNNILINDIITFSKSVKNLKLVFDVHGDEVSKVNYIYGNYDILPDFKDIVFLKKPSLFKRFFINLLRNRKIVFNKGCQASEYFEKYLKVKSYTTELSAHNTNPNICRNIGRNFINELNNNLKNY